MNILIVDDHTGYIESLKSIVSYAFEDVKNLEITKSLNCENAIQTIKHRVAINKTFDLAIIDYIMPPYNEEGINIGGDLCTYLKKVMPSCKTLINTGILEDFTLFEIDQKIKPDVLTLKSDLSVEDYIKVIQEVVQGKKFKSPYVTERINEIWKHKTFTQEQNRKIVELLALGYKIKEIANALSLSEVAIQKRIVKIKETLEIKDCNTSILREAKRRGYV